MSDCQSHETSGLAQIPSLVSSWENEFVSGWVNQARDKGYGNSLAGSAYINLVEMTVGSKSGTAAKQIENAVLSNDSQQITTALNALKDLSPADKLQAACASLDYNVRDRANNADVPKLELVTQRTNDQNPQLAELRVKAAREIAKVQF